MTTTPPSVVVSEGDNDGNPVEPSTEYRNLQDKIGKLDDDDDEEFEILPKHGHNFLFCGCDMRRAVIIFNTITIIVASLAATLYMIDSHLVDTMYENFDDDEFQAAADVLNAPLLAAGPYFLAVAIGKVAWGIIGILGAYRFEHAMVGFGSMSYFFDLALSIFMLNWIGLGYAVLMLYPHLVLIKEIHDGYMCAENYHNEQHCCCGMV